jgi:hypothetical protein
MVPRRVHPPVWQGVRMRRWLSRLMGARAGSDLHVGDPRFDPWPVVRDYEELPTARAFRQHLEEAGVEAVLTADWPLDAFGRGDIALRVPPDRYGDAEVLLDDL